MGFTPDLLPMCPGRTTLSLAGVEGLPEDIKIKNLAEVRQRKNPAEIAQNPNGVSHLKRTSPSHSRNRPLFISSPPSSTRPPRHALGKARTSVAARRLHHRPPKFESLCTGSKPPTGKGYWIQRDTDMLKPSVGVWRRDRLRRA
jgi:hypothetical protein